MFKPVRQQESAVFIESTVIKGQQELTAVQPQSLNRVRNARREIPQITHANIVHEPGAVGIKRRDAGVAIGHVGPFALFMPVQLTNAPCIEAHIHARNRGGDAELTLSDLAGPSTAAFTYVRVTEGKAQIW